MARPAETQPLADKHVYINLNIIFYLLKWSGVPNIRLNPMEPSGTSEEVGSVEISSPLSLSTL